MVSRAQQRWHSQEWRLLPQPTDTPRSPKAPVALNRSPHCGQLTNQPLIRGVMMPLRSGAVRRLGAVIHLSVADPAHRLVNSHLFYERSRTENLRFTRWFACVGNLGFVRQSYKHAGMGERQEERVCYLLTARSVRRRARRNLRLCRSQRTYAASTLSLG
jgi:hypothetical protein